MASILFVRLARPPQTPYLHCNLLVLVLVWATSLDVEASTFLALRWDLMGVGLDDYLSMVPLVPKLRDVGASVLTSVGSETAWEVPVKPEIPVASQRSRDTLAQAVPFPRLNSSGASLMV